MEKVTIGVILPLTGPAAVYGEHAKEGQVKAMQDLKDRFGDSLRVELRTEDGKGDPKASIAAYHKLRSEGVKIFVTTLSAVTMALKPVAENDTVLFFGDAAHPDITKGGNPLTFRHSNTAVQEAELLADRIASGGFADVAILHVTDEYGIASATALKELLTKRNLGIKMFEGYDKAQTDFGVLGTKVKRARPAAIVIIGFGNSMGLLLKHLNDIGLNQTTLASIGYIITGADKLAGQAASRVEYVTFDFPASQDTTSAPGPRSFEVLEFGTISLLGDAIMKVHGDPAAIGHHIRSVGRYKTTYETMVITSTGDITPALRLERRER